MVGTPTGRPRLDISGTRSIRANSLEFFASLIMGKHFFNGLGLIVTDNQGSVFIGRGISWIVENSFVCGVDGVLSIRRHGFQLFRFGESPHPGRGIPKVFMTLRVHKYALNGHGHGTVAE